MMKICVKLQIFGRNNKTIELNIQTLPCYSLIIYVHDNDRGAMQYILDNESNLSRTTQNGL
jgi:hypothetical protein